MDETFTLLGAEKGLRNGVLVQVFSCAISPLSSDQMAVLHFPTPICGVEDASIAFLDSLGKTRNVHSLLVTEGCIRSSVLHLPKGTAELRISVCVLKQAGFDSIKGRLEFPGRIRGLAMLALYVYKVNRLRGVSIPRFFVEKCQQLYKIGFRNLLSSPTSHIELRDFSSPDYPTWIRNSNENLSDGGVPTDETEALRLAIFLEVRGNRDLLHRSMMALTQLKAAKVDLVLIVENEDLVVSTGDLIGTCAVPVTVVSSGQTAQAMTAVFDKARWCCFLNEGDVVRKHAPRVLNRHAQANPETLVFYSDHDFLDGQERNSPWFKPAWNREYYVNFDYISRAVFYRTDWLSEQAALPPASHVHERLILQLGMKPAPRIERIPDVLFSFSSEEPSSGQQSRNERQSAISDCLRDYGIPHTWRQATAGRHGAFVSYQPHPGAGLPAVSLIIPTRDQPKLIRNCLESILKHTNYPDFEVIIVDNGSTNAKAVGYLKSLRSVSACTVLNYDQPFNYSAINNFAAQQAKGELIGLVNNDIEVISPGWLRDMAAYFWLADVGVVGAKLLYKDRSVQHAGVIGGLGNVAGHAHRYFRGTESGYMSRLQVPNEFSAVTGACMLTRKSLYETLGGLNSKDLAVAYNDVDYCLRVREKGLRIVYAPQAELFHFESKTRGREDTSRKKRRYAQERTYMWDHWRSELEDDEFYNPNLSRVREDFSVGNKPHSMASTR